ncbi:MAG: aspartate aminotransferase family protein [Solirubrobacterales bacterium]|nr:aspartate aminotransferase family protein [Solirubrobacterales bacterium]MBV9166407.1 aspartate aminotransferase family protein [Solirubrobacterales bacterium]MBV9534470.1 aspartate aminotransferase family protein [Solirubrobacterales bacterium]
MITSEHTHVFPRLLDLAYPSIERGRGVRLYTTDGSEVLDACSGGAMVACLGHGDRRIVEAARDQARRISYVYNHHFTNEPQERLAKALIELAAPEMTRVRFVSGGSEANETAIRLIRQYHVDRGEERRWRIISPAQAYHGALFGALALTGRHSLQAPYGEYLPGHLHIPPATWRFDPSGEESLRELDRLLEAAGPDTIAAFVCEPVGAAALPGYSAPERFWEGVAERRDRHGFLICFDEVVTGMGRTGSWFASDQLPVKADIITGGKGLGAGYAQLAATLCAEHIYEALAAGSRNFEHGHTWDGAPLPCAVGLAVLDVLCEGGLIERVRERGPSLREELEEALADSELVREVRGRGFLLGVEFVDPRDGESFLPNELDAAALVDQKAFEHGLLVTSTHSTADGYCGDQTLLAPAFIATDDELGEMVARFAETVSEVEQAIKQALAGAAA